MSGSVVVVGSGVTGLMTAWKACQAGFSVTVISQSPDPRTASSASNHASSTFDSPVDQRYVTLFEGHPYLELEGYITQMYPDIGGSFTRSAVEGGVLARPAAEMSVDAKHWLDRRQTLNESLKRRHPGTTASVSDLFEVYERENRAAMALWFQFLTTSVAQDATLAEAMPLHYRGVLRLYDDPRVFEQARTSHLENGVLRRCLTPSELVSAYPSYRVGVDNGFILGGALETVGLAFGVKAVCRRLIDRCEQSGVQFRFGSRVASIELDDGRVHSLTLANGIPIEAKHFLLHTGAYAIPSLFRGLPDASGLAAVAGYWLEVHEADDLVRGMGTLPNKVHGRQSLKALLERLPAARERWYRTEFDACTPTRGLDATTPVVDFNNMPIPSPRGHTLGVGSGYVFEGLAQPGESGDPTFEPADAAQRFSLLLMRLWLEALHGAPLLGRQIQVHETSCRRSWTYDDRELDINLPTVQGGLFGVRGGGNTGDTTKSTFVASYNTELLKSCEGWDAQTMKASTAGIRRALGCGRSDVTLDDWTSLTAELGNAMHGLRGRASSL